MSIFIRTVPNVMRHFGCSAEDAQRYIDLRDEGYGRYAAAVMAGLADPAEPSEQDNTAAPKAAPNHTVHLLEKPCPPFSNQL